MSSLGTALRATVMGTRCKLSAIVTVDHTFHLPSSLKPFFDMLQVFYLLSRSSPFTCLGVSFSLHTTQTENKVVSCVTQWSTSAVQTGAEGLEDSWGASGHLSRLEGGSNNRMDSLTSKKQGLLTDTMLLPWSSSYQGCSQKPLLTLEQALPTSN